MKITRRINMKHTKSCEFHSCLKHIITMSRLMGHFPVENLQQPEKMRFNLKSIYSACYLFSYVMLIQRSISSVYYLFYNAYKGEDTFAKITNLVFSFTAVITSSLMYRLAKHWPELVKDASKIEEEIDDVVRIPKSTRVKCAILSYAVIGLSVVEHITFIQYILFMAITRAGGKGLTLAALDLFIRRQYASIFLYIPFNRWLGIFGEVVSMQNSFLWNMTDVMGMCFSIYFSSYFKELGKIIHSNKPKNWGKIRACYSRLAILLNLVNMQMAPFILLATFCNLFFICMHMFRSLNTEFPEKEKIGLNGKIEEQAILISYNIYYVFSLLFLILRSMTFVYTATNVNTSANDAVLPLYQVSSMEYNDEVERFQMQLRFTRVGLSGVFFYVERQIILRVIATIVTYELVLLQFSYTKKSTNSTHIFSSDEFVFNYFH